MDTHHLVTGGMDISETGLGSVRQDSLSTFRQRKTYSARNQEARTRTRTGGCSVIPEGILLHALNANWRRGQLLPGLRF
jgi:hypothetical protein